MKMSEEGKLPGREEMIFTCPGSSSEALGMWRCQLCRLLCNNQAPKTKEGKSVIDMTMPWVTYNMSIQCYLLLIYSHSAFI